MFALMKSVIAAQRQPADELRRRIDVFFAQGRLSEKEKEELEALVFAHQSVDAERAGLEERYGLLALRMTALEARMAALEGVQEAECPQWRAWDGVSEEYQPGAVVLHKGKMWKNVLEGMQNVWEPGVADERYWMETEE